MISTKKNKYDRKLLIMTLFLIGCGLIILASSFTNAFVDGGPVAFMLAIAIGLVQLVIGLVATMIIQNKFNLKKILHYAGHVGSPVMVLLYLLMFATLLFDSTKGARAWIPLPFGFSFQPAEFLKIGMAVLLANHYATNLNNQKPVWEVLRMPVLFTLILFLFSVGAQNELGNGLIMVMISYAIFLAVPDKRFVIIKRLSIVAMVLFIILFYVLGPYLATMIYNLPDTAHFKIQLLRVAVLFDPMHDLYDKGYQVLNSLVAVSNGGIFGVGLGNSTSKMVIPEISNDAIIAVIAEETGLIGVIFLLVLYFLIVSRIINFAMIKNMDNRARLILIGIASYFVAQLFVNIGGMVGMIPMTGVTLLFISSGGSSILATFVSVGIIQAIVKEYIR